MIVSKVITSEKREGLPLAASERQLQHALSVGNENEHITLPASIRLQRGGDVYKTCLQVSTVQCPVMHGAGLPLPPTPCSGNTFTQEFNSREFDSNTFNIGLILSHNWMRSLVKNYP